MRSLLAITDYARNELEARMQAVDPPAGIDIEVYAGFPGLDTEPTRMSRRWPSGWAGAMITPRFAYGTEAGLFQSVAGIPTIVIGPGSIGQDTPGR